jgi:hypothetical protein
MYRNLLVEMPDIKFNNGLFGYSRVVTRKEIDRRTIYGEYNGLSFATFRWERISYKGKFVPVLN